MIKVAVTGSSGFIASHIYKRLKKKFKFTLYSRKKNKRYKFINDYSKIKNNNFDFLLYLSEEANSNIFNKYNNKIIKRNQKILDILSRRFKAKLIYFSSAAVYSDKNKEKIKENFKLFPKTKYSSNKLLCEKIVKKNKGIILRLTNIVGRKMPSRNIVTAVLKQLLNKNVKVVKIQNKFPIRDFLHIDDLVDLVDKIFLWPKHGIYNVGSGYGFKIENLVKQIIKHKNSKAKIFSDSTLDNFSKKVLDIKKVCNTFKWKPKIKISRNIQKIL